MDCIDDDNYMIDISYQFFYQDVRNCIIGQSNNAEERNIRHADPDIIDTPFEPYLSKFSPDAEVNDDNSRSSRAQSFEVG